MGDEVDRRKIAERKIVDYARSYARASKDAEEYKKTATLIRDAQQSAIVADVRKGAEMLYDEFHEYPWPEEAKGLWEKYLSAAQRRGRYLALLKKTVAQLEAAIADDPFYIELLK